MHKEPQPDEDERWPACQIKWEDAINFCNELSKLDGRKPCYSEIEYKITCNFNANGYRLPTEAEWNYAALGGINHDNYTYSGSDDIDEVAWYKDNSDKHLHEVATKKPNSLGIYDMTGNVWEWCWEEYGSNDHVFRGGCYLTDLERCPIFKGDNESNSRLIGFRVVCSVL